MPNKYIKRVLFVKVDNLLTFYDNRFTYLYALMFARCFAVACIAICVFLFCLFMKLLTCKSFSVYFQPNSPFSSTKPLQHDDKKNYDDEDNWSVASSYPLNMNFLMRASFRHIRRTSAKVIHLNF